MHYKPGIRSQFLRGIVHYLQKLCTPQDWMGPFSGPLRNHLIMFLFMSFLSRKLDRLCSKSADLEFTFLVSQSLLDSPCFLLIYGQPPRQRIALQMTDWLCYSMICGLDHHQLEPTGSLTAATPAVNCSEKFEFHCKASDFTFDKAICI